MRDQTRIYFASGAVLLLASVIILIGISTTREIGLTSVVVDYWDALFLCYSAFFLVAMYQDLDRKSRRKVWSKFPMFLAGATGNSIICWTLFYETLSKWSSKGDDLDAIQIIGIATTFSFLVFVLLVLIPVHTSREESKHL